MRINGFKILLCMVAMAMTAVAPAQVGRTLDIPCRLQWDNDGGYCGELSIQMIGMYHGNYISQDVARTVAGGEVLFGDVNGEAALDALNFNFGKWDYNQSTPQYQAHLRWMKGHLFNGHPVIFTVFLQGGNDSGYDHIIPAIGFTSTDTSVFHNSDELIFIDNYQPTPFTRTFQTMWDTRAMNGNGATYDYCIPRDVDYGCAVLGNKDLLHETKPVHVSLNRWDEPNVSIGESPVLLNATIKVEGLQPGARYALLRYNNYATVPASGFSPSNASAVTYFAASASFHITTASFMSNTAVFFRCVPDIFTHADPAIATVADAFHVFPNPCGGLLTVEVPKTGMLALYNAQGQLVSNIALPHLSNRMDVSGLRSGVYLLRMQAGTATVVKRFVKE